MSHINYNHLYYFWHVYKEGSVVGAAEALFLTPQTITGQIKALDDTLLQYLSPLGWEHINLTGDYLWRSSAKVGTGKFRPLRPLPPA